MLRAILTLLMLLIPGGAISRAAGDPPTQLPFVFQTDFSRGADQWQPTDPAAWKVVKTDKGFFYSQFQQSKYKPPHRSPFNMSLVRDLVVSDFVLDAKVLSTAKD